MTSGGPGRRRRGFDPADLGPRMYPLLNSLVVPRPIAWVSTRSADGVDNLAPHSYFTVASIAPPVVAFTSVGEKDTLRNVRETGEFVVAVVTRPLAERCNVGGTDFPAGVSEFDVAGLTREPSALVGPPRVAESPVALECRVVGEKVFGDKDSGGSTVVFGEVVHVAVSESVLAAGAAAADPRLLEPVARMGADYWSGLGEVFALRRVPYREWADGAPADTAWRPAEPADGVGAGGRA